jgi:type II secretory pathway pseudopilin PulG
MAAPTANRRLPGVDRRGQRGLTLAAALVTVLLVGLLAALFVVAVWTARGAAERAICTSHLRQVAVALAMYKDEYGDYPLSGYEVRGEDGELGERVTWQQALRPYAEDPDVFQCPRDPVAASVAESRPAQSAAATYVGSYVYLAAELRPEPPLAGRRAASAPAAVRRGPGAAAKPGPLLVCRHHDDEENDERRWVMAVYEDGAVKWEPARTSMPRQTRGRATGPQRVPRPGRNDW